MPKILFQEETQSFERKGGRDRLFLNRASRENRPEKRGKRFSISRCRRMEKQPRSAEGRKTREEEDADSSRKGKEARK